MLLKKIAILNKIFVLIYFISWQRNLPSKPTVSNSEGESQAQSRTKCWLSEFSYKHSCVVELETLTQFVSAMTANKSLKCNTFLMK